MRSSTGNEVRGPAPSFAYIFFNNCFKNGVLPVSLADAEVQKLFEMAETGEVRLTVDLAEQTVTNGAGLTFRFEIDPFRKDAQMKGLDDIGMTLQYAEKIAQYERDYQPGAPMYEAVDVKYAEVAK